MNPDHQSCNEDVGLGKGVTTSSQSFLSLSFFLLFSPFLSSSLLTSLILSLSFFLSLSFLKINNLIWYHTPPIPSHTLPFPSYPRLQIHWNEPTVSVQEAFVWHGLVWHSERSKKQKQFNLLITNLKYLPIWDSWLQKIWWYKNPSYLEILSAKFVVSLAFSWTWMILGVYHYNNAR